MKRPLVLLPGILLSARLRYPPLLAELGEEVAGVTKELEVHAGHASYSIEAELEALARLPAPFHLYGYSAGGAIGIAFACAHPDRVLSLAIDEPAFDFTDEERAQSSAYPEGIEAFLRSLVAPGVALPPPPPGPPADASGVHRFQEAARAYRIPDERFAAFRGPVYHSLGSLSAEGFARRRDRLARRFARFESETYEGRHHLATSHMVEPARVAQALRRLWTKA